MLPRKRALHAMSNLKRAASWFQDNPLPPDTLLVGYSALVASYGVSAPLRRPACVSRQHIRGNTRDSDVWRIYDKRYDPGETLAAQLEFALRHEDLDLLVLKRILAALPAQDVEAFVRSKPTGLSQRRLWFLYEHLLGAALPIPDAGKVQATDLLDPARYFTTPGEVSRRHKVRNNLLGTPEFCPIIRRTKTLGDYVARDLSARAKETLGRVGQQTLMKAANFLLLSDSKASFAIEGETPPRSRLERWGRAVLEASRRPLSTDQIVRLQELLLGDTRFVAAGLRREGVFLGERTRDGAPLPEFIGARPADLASLLQGLMGSNERMAKGAVDPVLQAAAVSFGFVYIHPLEDGNGRIHRCLVHQVLAAQAFTPPGMVFPVSSALADKLARYKAVLEAHSAPLMASIEWRETESQNVEVTNETADLYRYIDCTEAAEFLYECVAETVERVLPDELAYLQSNEGAMRALMERLPISDKQASDFILFVRQNGGKLSKNRREGAFAKLTDEEASEMENIVSDAFAKIKA